MTSLISTTIVFLMASQAPSTRCELQQTLRLVKQPGDSRFDMAKEGTIIHIKASKGAWTEVMYKQKKGYIRKRAIERFCQVVPDLELLPIGSREKRQDAPPPPPPDKLRIAVMNLTRQYDLPETSISAVTDAIPESLEELGLFDAVSVRDVEQMLAFDVLQQELGCDDMACWAEIGGALGARYLITGSVVALENKYLLQLQLTDLKHADVLNRVSREVERELSKLIDNGRILAQQLVSPLMEKNSGFLALVVSEEGATVRVDGKTIGVSPLPSTAVAGGTHEIEVEKTGFVLFKKDVQILPQEERGLRVRLIPSQEYVTNYRHSAENTRLWSWISIGVGTAGLGAAGALYFMNQSEADQLNQDVSAYNQGADRPSATLATLENRRSDLAFRDTMTLVAASVGVTAMVTGIILRSLGDDPGKYDATTRVSSPGVQAWFSPTSIGVGGSF